MCVYVYVCVNREYWCGREKDARWRMDDGIVGWVLVW